jgi:hypothetical protein
MPAKKKSTTDSETFEKGIMPVGDVADRSATLIYGKSGTGKTALASSWPKPILMLDIQEHGTDTIAEIPDIDIRQVSDWETFEQGYWYLKNNDTKYQSVVIDQISQLQVLGMQKIRADNSMDPTDTFSKRDWGQLSGMLQTWLLNYRDLWDRYHICMIAHERSNMGEEAIEDQIDPSIGPRVMPSLASFICGAVDVVGNTFIREAYIEVEEAKKKKKIRQVEYRLRVGPHGYYQTKVRKPFHSDLVIPDSIVNPNFEKLQAISRGEALQPKRVKRSK